MTAARDLHRREPRETSREQHWRSHCSVNAIACSRARSDECPAAIIPSISWHNSYHALHLHHAES